MVPASIEKITLFLAGDGGFYNFRIPVLVRTKKGALIAFAEAREDDGSDWAHSALVSRRCPDPLDNFYTWEPMSTIHVSNRLTSDINWIKMPYVEKYAKKLGLDMEADDFEPKVGVPTHNAVPIVDQDGKTIHLVFCTHYDKMFYTKSVDDGISWDKPIDITRVVDTFQDKFSWEAMAAGPGHGLQLEEGKHEGRLIVPVWLAESWTHKPSVATSIYSDDNGVTWQPGEIIPSDFGSPSEATAIQLADGSILVNARSHGSVEKGNEFAHRMFATSRDGAYGWSKFQYDEALPEPVCMGSIVRFTKDDAIHGTSRIIFTIPDCLDYPGGNTKNRRNLTAFLSYDECKTWSVKRTIECGLAGYSDLAIDDKEGWIYCLYEESSLNGNPWLAASFRIAKLNLEWLTNSKDKFKVVI
ncbi:MAG: exo-alpha-sialidase [Candidatus Hodarchaeota archaeon]